MSNFKGGYRIVDFAEKTITVDDATGVTVSGVYDAIEGSYRKPILIEGLDIDGVEVHSAWVNMCVGTDGAYHGIIGIDDDGTPLIVNIDDDDKITVTTYVAPTPDESGDGGDAGGGAEN